MAYVFDSKASFNVDSATSFEPDMPAYDAGDLLIVCVGARSTQGINISAGWTRLGTSATSNGQMAIFWRIASSPQPIPSFSLANLGVMVFFVNVYAIKEFDEVTPINTFARNINSAILFHPFPSITTTRDNCLILHAINSDTNPVYVDRPNNVGYAAIGTTRHFGFTQKTAGWLDSFSLYLQPQTTARVSQTYSIAINDRGDAKNGLQLTQNSSVIHQLDGSIPITFNALSNFIPGLTDIAGINLSSVDPSVGVGAPSSAGWIHSSVLLNSTENSANANLWVGGAVTLASSVNMTGKVISIKSGANAIIRYGSLYGNAMVLVDSAGNWKAFELIPRLRLAASNAQLVYIDPVKTPHFASSGVLNVANINRVMFMHLRRASDVTSNTHIISNFRLVDSAVITGGNLDFPNSYKRIHEALQELTINLGASFFQGSGQFLTKTPLQIGNGVDRTVSDFSLKSLEYPLASDTSWVQSTLNVPLRILASASDVVDFSSSILVTDTRQAFVIDSSSSATAEYKFTGASFKGWDVTWNSNVPATGIIFNNCAEVDGKSATFTRCEFIDGIDNAQIKLEGGAELIQCNFKFGGLALYAIEIPNAGNYVLDKCTFNGFTTAINVTATTGVVNINLSLGDTSPTFVSAGATVNINLPVITAVAQISNIVAGSRVQIFNETTDTELFNAIVSGTSYSQNYNNGTGYTSGDTVRVRIAYQSGATAKLPEQYKTIASASGWAILADQQDDSVYISNEIDGATVTEFIADYPNVQMDVNDLDGVTTVQRGYAWYIAGQMTENGIRAYHGAMTAEDAVNYRINTNVVSMFIENISPNAVVITGGRIYRADGQGVIAATSNSVQMEYGRAYAVSVSGGAGGATLAQIEASTVLAKEATVQKAVSNSALAAALSA